MLISTDATAEGFTIVEAVLDGTEVAELLGRSRRRISIEVVRAHGIS